MKTLTAIAAAALALGACADAESPTAALAPADRPLLAVLLNQTFELQTTSANPCVAFGHFVELSGRMHLLFRVTTDAAGGTHVGTHANSHYSAVEPETGIRYVESESFSTHRNTLENGAGTFTLTVPRVLIAQGDAPNFTVFELFHVTTDSNGEVTATHEETRVECRG